MITYNIMISCFHLVRYFDKLHIPVSTARFQPKWWIHEFNSHGVLTGLTIPLLAPNVDCACPCGHQPPCSFLKDYANSLPPFNQVKEYLDRIYMETTKYYGQPTTIVLLVYEKPDNPCSERGPLIEYFRNNGIEVTEYNPR